MENEKEVKNPALVSIKRIIGGESILCQEEPKSVSVLECLECGKKNLIIDFDKERQGDFEVAMSANNVFIDDIANQYDHVLLGCNGSNEVKSCQCGSRKTIRRELSQDLHIKEMVKSLLANILPGNPYPDKPLDNHQNNRQGIVEDCGNHHFILDPGQEQMRELDNGKALRFRCTNCEAISVIKRKRSPDTGE